MSKKDQNQRATLHEWQVARLRLTAFPGSSMETPEPGWWQNAVGQPPESETARPRSGELREEGPFETGVLTLNIQPFRIDWQLNRAQQEELQEDGLLTIGAFPQILEGFLRPMHRWLTEDCPELERLAFGAVLLLQVESRHEGYERLSPYLPYVKLDAEGSSDFSYRINRPRNSTVDIPGLRVNRVSKWSVAALVNAFMQINPTGRSKQSTGPAIHACALELDISTAVDFEGILSRDKLTTVFEELVEFGKEIVEEGDIS